MSALVTLDVLVITEDERLAGAVQAGLADADVRVHHARTVEAGVDRARGAALDVAFVDVASEGGAALALVHHLGSLRPEAAVFALVAPERLDLGAEALSLGARSVVVAPPTGDALLLAVGEVRTRIEDRRAHDDLQRDLGRALRRLDLTERVVRLANGAGHSEAVRSISDALSELSGARGVAIYATFDATEGGCVRLAALGTGRELPHVCAVEDLVRQIAARGASSVPLSSDDKPLGLAVLDEPLDGRTSEIGAMAALASSVLSLIDFRQAQRRPAIRPERSRAYSADFMREIAPREFDKAKRHGRRVSLLVWTFEARHRARLEDVVLQTVRETDVLAHFEEGAITLLLPETGALGAHACRRRVQRALRGERRAAPSSSDRGAERAEIPVAVGVATFPHDGRSFERLQRIALRRARDDARSLARALGLERASLGDLVDAVIARPIHDAGARSPYPLDIAMPALGELVGAVCRDTLRGGDAVVHATVQNEPGGAVAARREVGGASRPAVHVVDVRAVPGCTDVEAVVVSGEHGAWACCGRVVGGRFRGVHAADPLLADALVASLRAAGTQEAG